MLNMFQNIFLYFLFKSFIKNLIEQMIVIDMCQSNQQRMVAEKLIHFYDCRQDNVSSIYHIPDLLYAMYIDDGDYDNDNCKHAA